MEEVCYFSEKPIDLGLIQASWEAAFKRSFPNKYWNWRFLENPFENEIKVAYIINNETVAAYYAVSPLLIQMPDGQIVKSGLMNMGFTHPDFQGKNYYLKINNFLHERLKSENYNCCFGFANHNSHYPYRKYLNWHDLSILSNIKRTFHHEIKNSDNISELSFEISGIDESIIQQASLFNTCQKGLIHAPRSFSFLKWRILNHPFNKYECCRIYKSKKLCAIIFFKEYNQQVIDIIEYLFDPDIVAEKDKTLCMTLNYIQNSREMEISLWSNLYSEEHIQLEKYGFVEQSFSTYFGIINFNNHPSLNSIANWHYRYIDSDVY